MEKLAYTLKEFCELHSLSRTSLYKLFGKGDGPAVMSLGRHKVISIEAAAEWRARMTEASKRK